MRHRTGTSPQDGGATALASRVRYYRWWRCSYYFFFIFVVVVFSGVRLRGQSCCCAFTMIFFPLRPHPVVGGLGSRKRRRMDLARAPQHLFYHHHNYHPCVRNGRQQRQSTVASTVVLHRLAASASPSSLPPRFSRTTTDSSVHDMSLRDLLDELSRRNVAFSPTATRSDLELLYRRCLVEEKMGKEDLDREEEVEVEDSASQNDDLLEAKDADMEVPTAEDIVGDTPVNDEFEHDNDQDPSQLSLSDLLADLVESRVRFSPRTPRADLEQLWRQHHHHHRNHPHRPSEPHHPSDLIDDAEGAVRERARRRAARRASAEQHRVEESSSSSSWKEAAGAAAASVATAAATVLGNVPQTAWSETRRKVRKWSRSLADYVQVDDDGVRDVDFEYLHRDEALYNRLPGVHGTRYDDDGPQPPSLPRRRRVKSVPGRRMTRVNAADVPTRRVSDPRRGEGRPTPPSSRTILTKRPYLLPPAGDLPPPKDDGKPSDPPSSRRPKRKIYSPYGATSWPGNADGDDTLDRLGNLVADAAERLLWGPPEEPHLTTAKPSDATNPGVEPPPGKTRRRATTRHWRDRMEEQFDDFLGIHEEGATYNRWTEQAKNARKREGGHDAFSVARGVQPKRRGLSSPGRKVHDKPIWEEEGNLISLLFGRTQSGDSLLFEKLLDPKHGSMLYLFRAVFRSFMLVSSYVCRWASVRGAFPQPVVVLGVFTAALCAPRRRRLLAVTLALAVFRTLGELLHGYTYGNDGWEDDAEDDEEWEGEHLQTQ